MNTLFVYFIFSFSYFVFKVLTSMEVSGGQMSSSTTPLFTLSTCMDRFPPKGRARARGGRG